MENENINASFENGLLVKLSDSIDLDFDQKVVKQLETVFKSKLVGFLPDYLTPDLTYNLNRLDLE